MSWSFTGFRGSVNSKTSGAVLAVAPSQSIAVDAIVAAVCVSDNVVTGGGQSQTHVVADFKGNIWRKVREHNNAAVAAAGITLSVWVSQLTSQLLTTDSVVFGMSAAAAARAIGLYQYAVSPNSRVIFAGATSTEQDNTSSPTITLNGAADRQYAVLGVVARENDNAGTYTMDPDYNDRQKFGTTGGTGNTNVSCIVGDRVVTATGDTFNPTALSAASDVVSMLIAMYEIPQAVKPLTAFQDGDGMVYLIDGMLGHPLGQLADARQKLKQAIDAVDQQDILRAVARRLRDVDVDPLTASLGAIQTAIESTAAEV